MLFGSVVGAAHVVYEGSRWAVVLVKNILGFGVSDRSYGVGLVQFMGNSRAVGNC